MAKAFRFLLIFILSSGLEAHEGVVLLHGLLRSASSMEQMALSLKEAGFRVKNVDYPSRSATIRDLSDLAIGQALKDPDLQQCSRIHFVTHSLGGILVRSYFKRHAFPRLGRVVMLGPPNQGSEVVDTFADWWLFRKLHGPSGGELGTGDDSTPNRLGPVDFELGVIAGDRSINWINSGLIKGADDGKVSVERTRVEGMKEHIVLHVTHPYMMKNEVVMENTIRFLKTGTFRPPEPPGKPARNP